MSDHAPLRSIVSNEVRALLPACIPCVLAAIAAVLTGGAIHRYSVIAFAAALVGIGAQSVGHEYEHRTLDLMLTLPVRRRRLFLVKLTVLGAIVLPLGTAAWLIGLFGGEPRLGWIVTAAALCLAPSLTMLCRSQLAGLVFSLTLPPILLMAVMAVTGIWNAPAVLAPWSRLMVPVLSGGAVLGWWLFMRLESTGGGGAAIRLTWRMSSRRDPSPRHPAWQLVKKEVHLQQMTFAITVVYLAACATALLLRMLEPDRGISFVWAVTIAYALGVPALVGSLSTAEERQLGTLAWQLQLPTPAWQQWAAKVATLFSLTLLLSIGVPALVIPALWPGEAQFAVVPAIVMTAVSMYVSSLSATAARAAVTSVAAVSFVFLLALQAWRWSGGEGVLVGFLAAIVVPLLVGFAFVNHRLEQPAPARIWRQILSLAVMISLSIVVYEAVQFVAN